MQVDCFIRCLTDLLSCYLAVAIQFLCFRTAILCFLKCGISTKARFFALSCNIVLLQNDFIQMQLHNDYDYGIDYTGCFIWSALLYEVT